MTYNEYLQDCLAFAKDSEHWLDLDRYKFYTTVGNGYEETCDNCIGGLSVRWAFRKSADYVRENAPQMLLDEMASLLRVTAENGGADEDELYYIVEHYFR